MGMEAWGERSQAGLTIVVGRAGAARGAEDRNRGSRDLDGEQIRSIDAWSLISVHSSLSSVLMEVRSVRLDKSGADTSGERARTISLFFGSALNSRPHHEACHCRCTCIPYSNQYYELLVRIMLIIQCRNADQRSE